MHVVRGGAGARRLVAMRWGFLPHWYKRESDGPLLINARAETVAEKPAFRAAVRERRCLVVASGFYEWTKDDAGARLPWYITRRDGAPIAFAGLWQSWGQEAPRPTCDIVTTAANETLGAIHHRMPLILEPGDWPLWPGEAGHGAADAAGGGGCAAIPPGGPGGEFQPRQRAGIDRTDLSRAGARAVAQSSGVFSGARLRALPAIAALSSSRSSVARSSASSPASISGWIASTCGRAAR